MGSSSTAPRPQPAKKRVKKVNLWPRRIITGTGLLLIIALLGWGIYSLVIMATDATKKQVEGPQSISVYTEETVQSGDGEIRLRSTDKVTKDGIIAADDSVTIPRCTSAAIKYQASTTDTNEGAGEEVSVIVKNEGNISCWTTFGQVSLKITSGDQLIYDSAQCSAFDETATKLVLAPDLEWATSITWDGRHHLGGCVELAEGEETSSAPVAAAGTYNAQLYVGARSVTDKSAFVVIAPEPDPAA